jgi:type IV secretion system protein VirD4
MPPYLILVCAGGGLLLLLAGAQWLTNRTNLNGIKSRTVGDGQHGTARFATAQEQKQTYRMLPFTPALWRQGKDLPNCQGIIVGQRTGFRKTTAIVDEGDVHALMIGAAGCGKTAYFLLPNIELALASGMSFLCSDTKGDLARWYGKIAQKCYGYRVAVLDLRQPMRSDGFNLLNLVNKYADRYKADSSDVTSKARAEKYAKVIADTVIGDTSHMGQNSFFYDSAKGLLAAAVLIVAEFAQPGERHIISVFKLTQDLLAPSPVKGMSCFQLLMQRLPGEHKAKQLSSAALNTSGEAMASVLSTVLSRLNAFLDTEMEQLLCFDTVVDAERFCAEKTALFVILPEEDPPKYFLVSLIVQELYGELLAIANEKGGKLDKRVMFFLDEFGTLPAIQSADMMFSASRSRRISIVAIIQSYQQLEKNYEHAGSAVICDNCQLTIAGGFAPGSESADKISKSMGSRTVLSGTVTKGKGNTSQQLQMTERPLMSPDELKSMRKGNFIVLKTGAHPFISQLKLFFKWGIQFDEADPYATADHAAREVKYADKAMIEAAIIEKHPDIVVPEPEQRPAPRLDPARRKPQPKV